MALDMASRTRRIGVEVIEPARLDAALKATGMTQSAVCRVLEIDAKTMNNWVNGRVRLHRLGWFAITHALGLPHAWRPGDPAPTHPAVAVPNDEPPEGTS